MWLTYRQAKAFSCKPSDLMGVTDQPTAYYLDRAVFTFGSALEAELEKAGQQGKGRNKKSESQIAMAKSRILAKWIGMQGFAEPTKRG